MEKQIIINTILHTESNKFGLKISQLGHNTLLCIQCPRNVIKFLNDEQLASKSGIYFLLNREEEKIYVGQSDNIFNRLTQHNNDTKKDWFNEIIFFSTEQNNLSLTYVNYLEYHYIDKIFESKAWAIENSSIPKKSNLNMFEEKIINDLIKSIDKYLLFLDVSTKNLLELSNNSSNNDDIFEFGKAKLVYKNGKFIILSGSVLYDDYENKINNVGKQNKWSEKQIDRLNFHKAEIYKLLEDLKAERASDNHQNIILKFDLVVSSPSKAACFAKCSYAENGWNDWKNKSGKTLNEIYRVEDKQLNNR